MKKHEKQIELNSQLRVFLRTYSNIIDSTINNIRRQETDPITSDVLTMLIQSVGASTYTLFKITDDAELSIKDSFIIMRSVIETTINTCLIISDASYARAAHLHALQRTVKSMNRKEKIGIYGFETKVSMYDDFLAREDVQESIIKFSNRDKWTKENNVKKIEIIEKNLGSCVSLSGAYYSIYSEAAELMHGSYFGIINFYGFNKAIGIKEKFLSVQTEILFHAISCLNTLIQLGGKKYELKKEAELSNALFSRVLEKTKNLTGWIALESSHDSGNDETAQKSSCSSCA